MSEFEFLPYFSAFHHYVITPDTKNHRQVLEGHLSHTPLFSGALLASCSTLYSQLLAHVSLFGRFNLLDIIV